jgi:hypothetical protein
MCGRLLGISVAAAATNAADIRDGSSMLRTWLRCRSGCKPLGHAHAESMTDRDDFLARVNSTYKDLCHVERDFRTMKATDLDLRPIHHRLEDRVRAHVLLVTLAAYLVWHLRRAWAPLTYTDPEPPVRTDPVAPARRSEKAERKASRRRDADDQWRASQVSDTGPYKVGTEMEVG